MVKCKFSLADSSYERRKERSVGWRHLVFGKEISYNDIGVASRLYFFKRVKRKLSGIRHFFYVLHTLAFCVFLHNLPSTPSAVSVCDNYKAQKGEE